MVPQVSFRTRVVLLMIITTLLVVSLAGFAVERLAGQAVMAESEQHAQQLAATAAATIEGRFTHVAAFPKTLGALASTLGETAEARLAWYHATIPAMFAAAPPEVLSLTTFFEPEFIQGYQYAKVWYVRDNAGRIQEVTTNMPGEANYDAERPLYDYFPQEWYTAPLKAAGLVWSEPYFDAGGANVTMVTASIPVWYHSRLAGVATADVKLETINAFVDTIRPTPGSYALLISQKGTFIAHPRRTDVVLNTTIAEAAARMQSPALANLGAAMTGGENGLAYLRDPYTGTDVVAAYHPVKQTGWSLAVLIPEADLVQPVNRLRTTLLLLGGGAILVLALAGWLAAASVLRPITTLVRGVERFAVDRTTLQLGIRQKDELGRLAAAFEQMSAQVAGSYANLEQEVAARTVELQAALQERARQAHDLALALERVEQKDREIQALSIPVVPLLRDTFVLPIVGVLDANRAHQLTEVLLRTIAAHQARVIIVDVTGLAFIDEVVARLLLKAASAVNLLGAEIILVGVRPEVAQTLVALGISLDGLKTLGNLQAAVLETLHRTRVLPHNSTKVSPLNT